MLTLLRLVKRLSSLGVVIVALSAVSAVAAMLLVPQVSTIVTSHSSSAAPLVMGEINQRSAMYAADGTFLTYLAAANSEPVSLDQIPQPVIAAVLAMEDSAFYEHQGVNFRGIFRALVENVNAGGIEQGGSTITQQLVKMQFLTTDQNLDRKTTEAFYAMRLEQQYTKDEILERYLNSVYFGANSYGVRAAAETYWGMKDVSELGWEEAAMLAGLIRSPNNYNPTLHAVRAQDRRDVVVERLLALELINETQAERIRLAPLPDERQQPFDLEPTDYFISEARTALLFDQRIPLGADYQARYNMVYFGGLEIHTTFDPAAQAAAIAARDEHVPEDPRGFTAAVVAVDTSTSAVRAMVGGEDYRRSKFNLTTAGLRQPGSSMKTFVLAALFEAGYTPTDTVRSDRGCSFENPGGVPNPYEVSGGGAPGVQSIAAVTRSSYNCAFVRLGIVAGNDKVIEVSQRLGITSLTPADAVLSFPLGSKEVYPIEMATAYAAMANDGIVNDAYYIQTIYDRHGEVLYEHRPNPRRAISTQSARMITQTLIGAVQGGTGQRARLAGGHEAGGKTGTAQTHEDAWFVGFTSYLTTAVWMGNPDEKVPMTNVGRWGNMFGGGAPAAIWASFNNAYHADLEPIPLPDPDSYPGGRFLKVPGEIDFCNASDRGMSTVVTRMVDSDGDGELDCFVPVTTTTEAPEAPPDDGGGGNGDAPPPAAEARAGD